jgi:PHD/YefM family antitoxin component YafN of YafNO toxin-antitoxin module
MQSVPELMPISRLRQTQNKVLGKLPESPVVLTQHGRAVAVLVDPEMWNGLLEELETWQDSFAALEAKYQVAIGADEVLDWQASKALQGPATHDAVPA